MSIQDSRTNEEISNTVCQQDHYSVMEGGRGFEGCDQCCRIKEALDAKDSNIYSLEAKVVALTKVLVKAKEVIQWFHPTVCNTEKCRDEHLHNLINSINQLLGKEGV